jgi:CDP-diacylglycerol--serine O-phosphatidyltransferase
MILGLASIYNSTQGHYDLAAWMIVWGVLLDKLDGTSARLLNASSALGAELDSFADFVSFGLAVAALMFFSLREMSLVHPGWLVASSSVYVVAISVRLARFNVSTPPMGNHIFYGIPTTAVGGILSLSYLTWSSFSLPEEMMAPIPFVLLIASFAMVSNITLPKMKPTKNLPFNIFLFSSVVLSYGLGITRRNPEIILSLATGFVLFGIIAYALKPPKPSDFERTTEDEEEEISRQPIF